VQLPVHFSPFSCCSLLSILQTLFSKDKKVKLSL
jgi:hypothetical protein